MQDPEFSVHSYRQSLKTFYFCSILVCSIGRALLELTYTLKFFLLTLQVTVCNVHMYIQVMNRIGQCRPVFDAVRSATLSVCQTFLSPYVSTQYKHVRMYITINVRTKNYTFYTCSRSVIIYLRFS